MRFADYDKRVVFAAFDGGEITSDAGVLLLRERARRIRLFERMAGCFTDHRDRERLTHTLPALLAQRVCGMALGYEDIIDHDTLRFDPALKLLASPGTEYPGTPAPLAGKSTLNRLEQSWETGNRRYHQMVPNLKSLSNLFVALFLDACDTPPARITLDIDATDVEGARRTPSSTAITNTAVSCPSMSSAAAISCSPNSDPPTSMAPGVRATRSGASSR